MKFFVGIESNGHVEKPVNIAAVKWNTMMNYREYELEDIIYQVGEQGHALIPAYLDGGMKQTDFQFVQIFLLDFDGQKIDKKSNKKIGVNISFEEIKERAEKKGLEIAFAYKTLSAPESGICYKFRIAFIHHFLITDINISTLIYRMLLKVFPEADSACGEVSRLFLGGKGVVYKNIEARFTVVQLTKLMYSLLDNGGHLQRDIKTLLKGINIAVMNGKIAVGYIEEISIFGVKLDSPNIIILSESQFAPIFYVSKGIYQDEKELHQSRTCMKSGPHRVDLDRQKGICPLLDLFLSGEILGHMELFLLATNLLHMRNGMKIFMEIIQNYYCVEKIQKWRFDIKYIKGYAPQSCCEYCRFYQECKDISDETNIVKKILNDHQVYINREESYVDIEDAVNQLRQNIEKALDDPKDGIFLIKGQTGIGKTKQIMDMVMKYNTKRFLIAEPLCTMKKELYDELSKKCAPKEVKQIISVRDTSFLTNEQEEEYLRLHESGRHQRARSVVKERLKWFKKEQPYAEAAIEELSSILDGMRNCAESRIVVTTHAMLLNTSDDILREFDYIIIDEDILFLQMLSSTKKISKDCVEQLAEDNRAAYSAMATKMLKAEEGIYHRTDTQFEMLPEWDELTGNSIEDGAEHAISQDEDNDITDLRNMGAYVLENGIYHYLCIYTLPKMKYLVLSATYDTKIYEDYFKNMDIIEYPGNSVKYKGKLIQFTHHTLGRRSLQKNQEIYDYIHRITDNSDIDIISFKIEEKARNRCDLHYGNAVGVNGLKGRDIAIIGTPYKNEKAYLLPCCYLYGEIVVNGKKMTNQRVDYHGKNFVLMSYAQEDLQRFLLYSLESDLEQCIGRARLLREECTVYVFSAFPCDQAIFRTGDYLEKSASEKK